MDAAPFKVPGFGLPVNHRFSYEEHFPSALSDLSNNFYIEKIAVTLRELTMLYLMNTITDKPDWDSKVFDEELIRKWSEEARNSETMDVTGKMLDYADVFIECFDELQSKALSFKRTGMVASLECGSAVIKSDKVIDQLTPDKPEYEGGSWHVEGQMNERICASALLYYDSNNITDSHLEFRRQIDAHDLQDKAYGQDDYEGVEQIYGIEQEGPALQEVGRVLTRECRLLAFPNILHHRVSPFRLEDPNKAGHRKLLALFLVDPHVRILSTSNIPPQQRSWLSSETVERTNSLLQRTAELPNELVDKIVPHISFSTVTLDEAKEFRLKLMEERKAFVYNMNGHIENFAKFNFCEH